MQKTTLNIVVIATTLAAANPNPYAWKSKVPQKERMPCLAKYKQTTTTD